MKTKIIYISGGEIFPPAEVRSAMEAVRNMLGLDSDTIIFGVPVDGDDVMVDVAAPEVVAAVPTPAAPLIESEPIEEPEIVEKPKKTRKKKEIIEEVEEPKPISVTPILSVIGTVNSDAVELAGESVTVLDAEDAETCASSTEIIIDDFGADSDDAIKSIEDIFADIAPIAEDRPVNLAEYDDATDTKSADADQLDIDLDATLSKLATEFAASQDEGAPATRSPEGAKGGKIGKLKNILPFKKKERSEGSVLGDLFGWAGVAANDDAADFAIPEFFRMSN